MDRACTEVKRSGKVQVVRIGTQATEVTSRKNRERSTSALCTRIRLVDGRTAKLRRTVRPDAVVIKPGHGLKYAKVWGQDRRSNRVLWLSPLTSFQVQTPDQRFECSFK